MFFFFSLILILCFLLMNLCSNIVEVVDGWREIDSSLIISITATIFIMFVIFQIIGEFNVS